MLLMMYKLIRLHQWQWDCVIHDLWIITFSLSSDPVADVVSLDNAWVILELVMGHTFYPWCFPLCRGFSHSWSCRDPHITWHMAMSQAIGMDYFCVPFVCDSNAHWTLDWLDWLDYPFPFHLGASFPAVGTESHTSFPTAKDGGSVYSKQMSTVWIHMERVVGQLKKRISNIKSPPSIQHT